MLPLSFTAAEKGAPPFVRYLYTPSDSRSCAPRRLSGRGVHHNAFKSFAIQCSTGSTPFLPFSISAFPFPALPNPFRINTYKVSRKCCIQRTYRIVKSFRFRTYKKTGGRGGVMVNQNPTTERRAQQVSFSRQPPFVRGAYR